MNIRTVAQPFAAAALGAFLVGAGVGPADARDDGSLATFFSNAFGLGAQPQNSPPIWSEEDPYDRPLVVRPRHKRAPSAPKVATVKGPTPKVSIYQDPTLRRGDAVMTASGMRIFRGSATMPYQDSDFLPVSQSSGLSKDVTKTLIAMDRVPRS